MEDHDRESKEDNTANPLMEVKKGRARIGAEDLIAEAVWLEEGHPIAKTRKTIGTEVILNDATFSEHNLSLNRFKRINLNEKRKHRFKRYQNNILKQQLSSTSLSDGHRR